MIPNIFEERLLNQEGRMASYKQEVSQKSRTFLFILKVLRNLTILLFLNIQCVFVAYCRLQIEGQAPPGKPSTLSTLED